MSESIFLAEAVRNRKAILLPCPIKKREKAMIENVQKRLEALVLGPQPLQYELAVCIRKNSNGTGEAHEIHFHLRGRVVLPANLLNLAGRKSQFVVHSEMNRFVLRIRKPAHRLAIVPKALQQSDRLKEFKRARVFSQDLFQQRTVQIKIFRPARGNHSCRSSFL